LSLLLKCDLISLIIYVGGDGMERLKQLRLDKGLYQKDIAAYLGVDRTTYVKYENGSSEPDNKTLSRIADYFGVTVDYLLGREETKKPLVTPAVTTDDEELIDILEELRSRPEMRMLFSLSKNATKQDVEDAVRIIEALRKGRQD